jgi:hypothetical protein
MQTVIIYSVNMVKSSNVSPNEVKKIMKTASNLNNSAYVFFYICVGSYVDTA